MARPFSPSSMPSYGATPRVATPPLSDDVEPNSSSSATRSTRICRSLVVRAAAHDQGVGATLYCRIAIPASMSTATGSPSDYASTQRTIPFLTLPVTAQLKHYSSYPLPLETSLHASVTEAAQAAHILGIAADDSQHLSGRTTPSGRRSSLATSRPSIPHNREIRIFRTSQDANEISLVVEYEAASGVGLGRPTSPLPPVGPIDEAGEKNEWILVLRIESQFGDLKLPRFPNKVPSLDCSLSSISETNPQRIFTQVVIPVPACLRNLLTFELPSPSSIASTSLSASTEGQWGLSMKPDLRNLSSKLSTVTSLPTTSFTGSFKSTSSVVLSWNRLDSPPANFIIPHSHLDVRWNIGPTGTGRAMLACTGDFEYSGLKDKRWIEIIISHLAREHVDQRDVVQVAEVRGAGVLKWDVAASSSTTTRTRTKRQPCETPLAVQSMAHATPTTQARPRALGIAESGPLSYTSLFDTTAPEAPEIDPGLAARIDPDRVQAKLKEPSLLRQVAPFPSQADDSVDDSLEDTSENESLVSEAIPMEIAGSVTPQKAALIDSWLTSSSESEPEPSEEIREADSDSEDESSTVQRTIVRVQLDLSTLLTPEAMPNPAFAFEMDLEFASGALRSSTEVAESGPASKSIGPLRLVLPNFSIAAAAQEDAVVSVSAGDGRSVEMLASNSMLDGDFERSQFDSPLPAAGGKARWRTERNASDVEQHELVEVEIVTRPVAQPYPAKSRIDLDDMDSSPDGSAAEDEASPSLARARRGPARKRALPPLLRRTTSAQSLRSQSSQPSLTLGHRMSSSSLVGLAASNLGLVKLRITPVPPLAPYQPWRLFSHLTLARPVGSLELPLRGGSDQKVEVCDTWDARGLSTEVETETKEGKVIVEGEVSNNRMTVRESPREARQRQGGMKEMLYKVEMMQEGDSVEIGDVLPAFDVKVASMEVEVVPVAGYDLKMDGQTFDSATPVVEGKPTTFSKFQIAPRDMSKLSIHLEAKVATPPASPSTSVGFVSSPTILPSPSPLAMQAVGSPASAMGTPPLSPIPALELDNQVVPQNNLSNTSRPWTWPLLAMLASILLGFIARPESFASMYELATQPRFSAPSSFPAVPLSSAGVHTEVLPLLTLDAAPVVSPTTAPSAPAPTPAPIEVEDIPSPPSPSPLSDETLIPQPSSNINLSPGPTLGTALVTFVQRMQSEVKARIEDLLWVVMSLIGLS
ncbi:BZ3500_MvSof-1268-A1-R1_Chr4-2g06931 [Microbotryum saponariae]|uniref:BZ3500_MvSof-1268-A1-R1_Chr4-2g06931 protein n=1 Tax=Microbotryum saponariae TaxID=289078 RepID=A0A2X0MXI7_9BASI|nr:BZ3500_MvSof-1268-A1-R1_Chr4-2g06931 [Microbotryum saponariae]SDA06596.1 BZ3501_MvSof-1269-A2-R1_Chr4-2g06642 [Microbotryum saponariae]